MKVLLIEDDEPTAAYIAKGLRQAGHEVDHSADGRDGLVLATTCTYDAAVVDRMVAGLNALARRPPITSGATTLQVGDLIMDLVARTVRRAGQPISLQPREFK